MSTADTGTRGSGPGELPRRRVLLLAESAGLAAVLHHLLDPADRLSRLGTLRELSGTRALESADVVILDVPAEDRAEAVGQVRRRYLGPLVVVVAKGDDTAGLHLDDAASLLTRPFSADALAVALGPLGHQGGYRAARRAPVRPSPEDAAALVPPAAVGPEAALAGAPATIPAAPLAATAPAAPGAAPPADAAKVLADVKAAARQAPVRVAPTTPPGRLDLIDRVQRALVALTQGWKARRRVRVAGFSAFALVAFTVAFVLAAQGRCGPDCDAFGTVYSPEPTIAGSQSTTPSTTGPKRSTTTAAAQSGSAFPGTGAYRGISDSRLAPTTTTRQATTTTRRPPTTRPVTTQPATTKATTPPTTTPPATDPPTTAPPTTGGA